MDVMAENIRITETTLKVLRAFLDAHPKRLAGADLLNGMRIFSGTLYPTISRLEAAGWIEGEWEDGDPTILKRPRRRFFVLTALGQRRATEELLARGASEIESWAKPIHVLSRV